MLRIDATPVARVLGAALLASAIAGCAEDCERLGIFGPSRVSAAHVRTAYAAAGGAADRAARASSAPRAQASAPPAARASSAPSAPPEPASNAMPPVQAL